MVILNVKLDKILSFQNFDINFSYPVKLQKTLLDEEYLHYLPSFRYKKLNIFIGSNSSGKTSLMKAIWQILVFLNRKNINSLQNIIDYSYKESYIEIDLAEDNENIHKLHKFKIKTINESNTKVLLAHNEINLTSNSSYEKEIKTLERMEYKFNDYLEELNKIEFISGCNIALPATEDNFNKILFAEFNNDSDMKDYNYILSNVMKVLDPSISSVVQSKDATNAYVIEYFNGIRIIVQENMKLTSIPYLSSGTKYGFNIANMIYSIKHHLNGIYLIDEQFSYVNSDIEAALISTMASLLGENEQLFITTHNSSILSLGFPFHSFYFMKKEFINNKYLISVNCASEVENRNNVSPKTISDNDIFGSAPKLDRIFKLGENFDE